MAGEALRLQQRQRDDDRRAHRREASRRFGRPARQRFTALALIANPQRDERSLRTTRRASSGTEASRWSATAASAYGATRAPRGDRPLADLRRRAAAQRLHGHAVPGVVRGRRRRLFGAEDFPVAGLFVGLAA